MSENCDSDTDCENQGLRFLNPARDSVQVDRGDEVDCSFEMVDNSRPRNFETNFSGSFLEQQLFGNGRGFGDCSEEEDEPVEKEQFVGLDWDARTIFKSLACEENNREKAVCALRLHTILTKSELAVQQMTRQIILCGNIIQQYNDEEKRDLGFKDSHNIENLSKMLDSLRANVDLMLIETEDLRNVLEAQTRKENSSKRSYFKYFAVGFVSLAVLHSLRGRMA